MFNACGKKLATLQRGWRGLHAVKPCRPAHPYTDDQEAAHPRLCPLPPAIRSVACCEPWGRGGSADGEPAAVDRRALGDRVVQTSPRLHRTSSQASAACQYRPCEGNKRMRPCVGVPLWPKIPPVGIERRSMRAVQVLATRTDGQTNRLCFDTSRLILVA